MIELLHIRHAPGVLTRELCDTIVDTFESQAAISSREFCQSDNDDRIGKVVTMRDSAVWGAQIGAVHAALDAELRGFAGTLPGLEAMIRGGYELTIPRVEKIAPGEGFTWHVDAVAQDARFLTLLVYLNDVHKGGQTEFLEQELVVNPTAGALLIFPCFWTHVHRGHPPREGFKYTLSCFAACTD